MKNRKRKGSPNQNTENIISHPEKCDFRFQYGKFRATGQLLLTGKNQKEKKLVIIQSIHDEHVVLTQRLSKRKEERIKKPGQKSSSVALILFPFKISVFKVDEGFDMEQAYSKV